MARVGVEKLLERLLGVKDLRVRGARFEPRGVVVSDAWFCACLVRVRIVHPHAAGLEAGASHPQVLHPPSSFSTPTRATVRLSRRADHVAPARTGVARCARRLPAKAQDEEVFGVSDRSSPGCRRTRSVAHRARE